MSDLLIATLGFAGAEVDHKIREVGGNNRGPRVQQYLADCDPPIAAGAPWCAAFVQFCSDRAARVLGVNNPLDAVKLEAYVQSYYDWGSKNGKILPWSVARPGYLILFNFHGQRWDHIGFVARVPKNGILWTIEGNTGDVDQRDGDGVYMKPRDAAHLTCTTIGWA